MKAMVLKSPAPIEQNPLEPVELPDPQPAAGEIRIRVRACGVCHTDLHEVEGEVELVKRPVVPGHQIVGVVDRLVEGVSRFRVGDRVGVPWLNHTCGRCRFCKEGNENLCEDIRFTGLHADGGYAQFTIVSEQFAYPVPNLFSDVEAAPLLCAGIIGYRALCLSEIQPGRCLGLYGFGASAHIAIQVARYWGCRVYVFSRSPEHRDLAHQLGAAWTGRAEDEPPDEVDGSIIFAPAGPLVPAALRVLRKGGTLALAGIHMSDIPQMAYELLYGERTVRSVANSTRQDAEDLLALAGEIPIQTQVQLFPLAQANQALQLLKASRIRGAGVLEVPAAGE